MKEAIANIWDAFICPDGASPAFFPSDVVRRTQRRIELVSYYGPHVFEESTIDHMRNIHREIRPQFLQSSHFQDLRRRMKALTRPPSGGEYVVPLPLGTLLSYCDERDFPDDRRFTLDEILGCRVLFTRFLEYLRESYNSECLLCYRHILIFKARMERGCEAVDESWDIYKYFIAPGAQFEVSCNQQMRKKVMLALASPKLTTYDEVLQTVSSSLSAAFAEYSTTQEYAGLSRFLRFEKKAASVREGVVPTGCFSF